MKLDFYHWSCQCPLNFEMVNLLSEYAGKIDIAITDITERSDIAKEHKIFFPTLTVVNGVHRFFSPLKKSFLDELAKNNIPVEKPYIPIQGTDIIHYEIKPLTRENYFLASSCTGRENYLHYYKKQLFYDKYNQDIYGFINTDDPILYGGAEYLPSLTVPYDIPKDEKYAFITCVYMTDPRYDYKSAPLMELENYLRQNYERVYVISDESGSFPNGNMDFFLRNNYVDEGLISVEENYCRLHLMSKKL